MKNTGLNCYVYDFYVGYNAIAVNDILSIHKYLINEKEWYSIKCLDLFKKFVVAMVFFICNAWNVNQSKCVSMKNKGCKTRTKIIDVNNNEPPFYPYSNEVNKCVASCSNISDPYAKLCVPDVVKKKS